METPNIPINKDGQEEVNMFVLDREQEADQYMQSQMGEHQLHGFILDEMDEYKTKALTKIKTFVHSTFAEDFARTLSYGYSEGIPEAKRLAKAMNFDERHMAALEDDYGLMKKLVYLDVPRYQQEDLDE